MNMEFRHDPPGKKAVYIINKGEYVVKKKGTLYYKDKNGMERINDLMLSMLTDEVRDKIIRGMEVLSYY